MMDAVIVGIGNRLRGDDGAGPAVIDLLSGDLPERVRVVECRGDLTGVLDAWWGARRAVVVDAVVSGAEPGTVHRIDDPDRLPTSWRSPSSHLVGLGEALQLGRVLGSFPEQLSVYGIEAGDVRTGSELSPAVRDATERIAGELREDFWGMDA